jgi:hypothetical protein
MRRANKINVVPNLDANLDGRVPEKKQGDVAEAAGIKGGPFQVIEKELRRMAVMVSRAKTRSRPRQKPPRGVKSDRNPTNDATWLEA